VPWTRLEEPNAPADTPGTTVIWHKASVPYLRSGKACALQTLDIWIPASNPNTNPPSSHTLPSPEQGGDTLIIYLHGGAWRDPFITASSFTAAATNLLHRNNNNKNNNTPKIAGLISLNYRLSPHPAHPASDPSDPSRHAAHPDHNADVLAGLSFVHRLLRDTAAGKKKKWILAGHSCGATLAFQAVMDPVRWGLDLGVETGGVVKPDAVVGFNGLYDLAGFIRAPPEGYGHLREGYREFVEGAFGGDEKVWGAVCPATAEGGWVREWVGDGDEGEGKKKGVVVLVQSREDTLVPWRQVEVMRACLEREGSGRVDVRVLEAEGDHNEIWQDGRRMAEVLWEVVAGLE
jgi:acetyl esterase/lipase